MTGIIIFLIGVSSIMSWVMAFTGIPTAISNGLLGLTNNKFIILLIINILLLVTYIPQISLWLPGLMGYV